MTSTEGKITLHALDCDRGARFARESLKFLLACRESREVYLENYDFLQRADNLHYELNDDYTLTKTTKIHRYSSSRMFVNKKRDTFLLDASDIESSEPDLAQIDFGGVQQMAFHGYNDYTSDILEAISGVVSRCISLHTMDFVLGTTCFYDLESFYVYQFLKVDSDFTTMKCQNIGTYPYLLTYTNEERSNQLLTWYTRANVTRLSYSEAAKTSTRVWKNVLLGVSILVKIQGPSYEGMGGRIINLIPRNPKYSGVGFFTIIGEEIPVRRNGSHHVYMEALDCAISYQFDGTILHATFKGIADLMDGKWL
ncbi:hypothetical protein BDZ45DRAFT_694728 [Acephala macrosclerotiorum]|nr:hypothetical protein BDZ45DRAFT_694728 [Acephala macrosclerotiorum]